MKNGALIFFMIAVSQAAFGFTANKPSCEQGLKQAICVVDAPLRESDPDSMMIGLNQKELDANFYFELEKL